VKFLEMPLPPFFTLCYICSMSKDSLMDIWERVREEIRRQRGMNRFRGQETHLVNRRQVRIPLEFRAGKIELGEMVIHLREAESEVYVEELPGGKKWSMAEFDMDLNALVGFALDRSRGADYLHTNSGTADYRKKLKNNGNADEKV
jgi:hypothetical protein